MTELKSAALVRLALTAQSHTLKRSSRDPEWDEIGDSEASAWLRDWMETPPQKPK